MTNRPDTHPEPDIYPVELRAVSWLHTLETHEADYLAAFGHPCDDPDCEFHHPEVRES